MKNSTLIISVFTLSDSDSYTDSNENESYNNVQNYFHWIYTNPYSDSYSDSTVYCTQFGTNKVKFNSFSLLLCIGITIAIGPSLAFLHIIGIGVGIGVGQCKHTITESHIA